MAESLTLACPPIAPYQLQGGARCSQSPQPPRHGSWLPALPGTGACPHMPAAELGPAPALSTRAKECSLTLPTPSLAPHVTLRSHTHDGFAARSGARSTQHPPRLGMGSVDPASSAPPPEGAAASPAAPGLVGVWQTGAEAALGTVPVPSRRLQNAAGASGAWLDPSGGQGSQGNCWGWEQGRAPALGEKGPSLVVPGRVRAVLREEGCGCVQRPALPCGLPKLLSFISELIKSWALSIRHHIKHIVVS